MFTRHADLEILDANNHSVVDIVAYVCGERKEIMKDSLIGELFAIYFVQILNAHEKKNHKK